MIFEVPPKPTLIPQTDDGSEMTALQEIEVLEQNIDAAALITEAYVYGARHEDVVELLYEHFPDKLGKLNMSSYTKRLHNVAKSVPTPIDHPVSRDKKFVQHLEAIHQTSGSFTEKRNHIRLAVKNHLKLHEAASFWVRDEYARVCAIPILRRILASSDPERPQGGEKIAPLELSRVLRESLGIQVSDVAIDLVLRKNGFLGKGRDSERAEQFIQRLVEASPPLAGSLLQQGEQETPRLISSALRMRSLARQADWKSEPRACAIVATLLTRDLPPEGQRMRRLVLSGRVPLGSIASILNNSFSAETTRVSLRTLFNSPSDLQSEEARRSAAERLLALHTYTGDEIESARAEAERLWGEYLGQVEERAHLQAEIFRNEDATCLAVRLLEDTSIPFRRIAMILQNRYKIPVTPDQFTLMSEGGDRVSRGAEVGALIRSLKSAAGTPLNETALSVASVIRQRIEAFENEIESDKRQSIPEISELLAAIPRSDVPYGKSIEVRPGITVQKRREPIFPREVEVSEIDFDLNGETEEDETYPSEDRLLIFFDSQAEVAPLQSRSHRALFLGMVRSVRAMAHRKENELTRGLRELGVRSVSLFGEEDPSGETGSDTLLRNRTWVASASLGEQAEIETGDTDDESEVLAEDPQEGNLVIPHEAEPLLPQGDVSAGPQEDQGSTTMVTATAPETVSQAPLANPVEHAVLAAVRDRKRFVYGSVMEVRMFVRNDGAGNMVLKDALVIRLDKVMGTDSPAMLGEVQEILKYLKGAMESIRGGQEHAIAKAARDAGREMIVIQWHERELRKDPKGGMFAKSRPEYVLRQEFVEI
jgi:hypothetical protein